MAQKTSFMYRFDPLGAQRTAPKFHMFDFSRIYERTSNHTSGGSSSQVQQIVIINPHESTVEEPKAAVLMTRVKRKLCNGSNIIHEFHGEHVIVKQDDVFLVF